MGSPTISMDTPVRRATVKAIGISSTKPTSKNRGRPQTKAMQTMAQCAFRSPNRSISVSAMRSAPPDSAIILPSMVPKATTRAVPEGFANAGFVGRHDVLGRHASHQGQAQGDQGQHDEGVD